MPHRQIIWFCVADAGTARIKQATSLAGPLTSVTTIAHEPYEHGRYEAPMRVHESASPASHGITDSEGPVRREKREFAHAVAEHLNEGAERGAYHRLILAAPPKFLGDLRAALGDKARERVVGEIHKDLTKESDAQLAARMGEAAALRG